jgi:hypothetical protein
MTTRTTVRLVKSVMELFLCKRCVARVSKGHPGREWVLSECGQERGEVISVKTHNSSRSVCDCCDGPVRFTDRPTSAQLVAATVRVMELCMSGACVVCKGTGGDMATGPCIDCGGSGKHAEVP